MLSRYKKIFSLILNRTKRGVRSWHIKPMLTIVTSVNKLEPANLNPHLALRLLNYNEHAMLDNGP